MVMSAIAVWLTTRRSIWNYPFSFASVALYAHIFFRVKLYADMGLQFVFAVALAYGLRQWTAYRASDGAVHVSHATRRELWSGVAAGIIGAVVLGWFTSARTDAALPWLDATLTAGSLVASWWAARRRIENWWLWIAVDVVYVGVYAAKGLELTAGLYGAFVVLASLGLIHWQRAYRADAAQIAAAHRDPASVST